MSTDELFWPIVTTDALRGATDDAAWVRAMLDAEAALARAEAATGAIPPAAGRAIDQACNEDDFDVAELGRLARQGGNPVIPLVEMVAGRSGAAGLDWVHWGATSQDILDTAAVLIFVRTGALIDSDLGRLAAACAELAERHRDDVMVARTLLQPAVPTTFGLKAAGWLGGVVSAAEAFARARQGLRAQLGGAAGTLASLGADGPAVAAAFARELGLGEPVLPWHTARQPIIAVTDSLGMIAGTAAKISGDVGLAMQHEVAEVFEPAGPGTGGSSTLPHKRNPVGAAAVGAAARRAQSLTALIAASLVAEHERSLVSWPVEWQSLGDLLCLSGGAVARTADTLAALEVDTAQMARAVADLAGVLLAERIRLALVGDLGRDGAKGALARALRRAPGTRAEDLRQALAEDPAVTAVLDEATLTELLDPWGFLGSSQVWIDRALEDYARWMST